jgi:micrococcal nuclease
VGFVIGRVNPAAPKAAAPASVEEPTSDLARCIKVLDGDTVRVRWRGLKEDVRILGIDCPETRRGKKLTEQARSLHLDPDFVLRYGEIAKKTTSSWLLNRSVTLVFPNDEVQRDAFGRLLAYVEEQGVDVGARLLAGGNAFLWDSVHPRRETYLLLEADARKQKKGAWRAL